MIYLDNAATSFPKPKSCVRTMEDCILHYCGNPGRSGHAMSLKTGAKVYEARASAARLFGAEDPSSMVFTFNATDSLNLAIKGSLKPGDHVVTTSMEHNSVLRPLKALEKQGVTTTVVYGDPCGRVDPEGIRSAIRPETALIICTHASNVTGTILPVEQIGQIAREKGIRFLVDASQSAGALDVSAETLGADLIAVPGHKGLLGPLGTGLLYVKPGCRLHTLKEGGTGTASRDLRQPEEAPERYESGTLNAPALIGLGASIEVVRKLGWEQIRAHELRLVRRLEGKMRNMDRVILYGPDHPEEKMGVIAFNIEGMDCEDVGEALNQCGIAVRSGFHCAGLAHKTIGTAETGCVRISVGPSNSIREMDQAAEAIWRIANKKAVG
ncbi:MAG: aminotransferase class V-fold PLP-dependent enzyme [Firmicutes bacterium]|nr:aminotransferase class V-fold PLP-dependent enzyme [Bacillota bacterium]